MGTCNGPSRNTISVQHTLDPPRNSLDSFAQVLVMTLRDGMGVPRVYQANPHHHKVTNNFVWMQHGYGIMNLTSRLDHGEGAPKECHSPHSYRGVGPRSRQQKEEACAQENYITRAGQQRVRCRRRTVHLNRWPSLLLHPFPRL